jgi:hypothetical protein
MFLHYFSHLRVTGLVYGRAEVARMPQAFRPEKLADDPSSWRDDCGVCAKLLHSVEIAFHLFSSIISIILIGTA